MTYDFELIYLNKYRNKYSLKKALAKLFHNHKIAITLWVNDFADEYEEARIITETLSDYLEDNFPTKTKEDLKYIRTQVIRPLKEFFDRAQGINNSNKDYLISETYFFNKDLINDILKQFNSKDVKYE